MTAFGPSPSSFARIYRRLHARLQVEWLEDRASPAVYTVDLLIDAGDGCLDAHEQLVQNTWCTSDGVSHGQDDRNATFDCINDGDPITYIVRTPEGAKATATISVAIAPLATRQVVDLTPSPEGMAIRLSEPLEVTSPDRQGPQVYGIVTGSNGKVCQPSLHDLDQTEPLDTLAGWMLAAPEVVVGGPDVSQGYGPEVDVPMHLDQGIPLTITSAMGVTSLRGTILYDPILLAVDAVTLADGLPEGATVTVTPSMAGELLVEFNSPMPLRGNDLWLLDLQARVPESATLGVKQLLRFDIEEVEATASLLRMGSEQATDPVDRHGNRTLSDHALSLLPLPSGGWTALLPHEPPNSPRRLGELSEAAVVQMEDIPLLLQEFAAKLVPEFPVLSEGSPLPAIIVIQPDPSQTSPIDGQTPRGDAQESSRENSGETPALGPGSFLRDRGA